MARQKNHGDGGRPQGQKLTPEQCAELAASFKDLPPEYQLSAADLEAIEEEVHGKPLQYGTPAEAVAAMERRIAECNARIKACIDAIEAYSELPAEGGFRDDKHLRLLEADLAQLRRELLLAETRRDAYDFQRRHQN